MWFEKIRDLKGLCVLCYVGIVESGDENGMVAHKHMPLPLEDI